MEPLTVPPAPNWYETKIAICAPDNTLIYGANNSLVIVKPAPWEKPSEISVISFAHLDRVHGLAMAPTWNEQHKMIASTGDDKLVKVWNMLDNTCAYSHKTHTTSKSRPVGVAFINDTKLVSVSEDGFIVIWKMTTDEVRTCRNLLGLKTHVTAISTCPHAGWLTAFGMRNGLVVIANLKGHGSVLYKLRAHEREVLDFAWCPQPINVIPDPIINRKSADEHVVHDKVSGPEVDGSTQIESQVAQDTIDAMPANGTHLHCAINSGMPLQDLQQLAEVTSEDPVSEDIPVPGDQPVENACSLFAVSEDEPKSPLKPPKLNKKNPWADLKHADDDEILEAEPPAEPASEVFNTTHDFLRECLDLKAKIIETKGDDEKSNWSMQLEDSPIMPTDRQQRRFLQAMRMRRGETPNVVDAGGDAPSTDIVSDVAACSDDAGSPESSSREAETAERAEVATPKEEFLLASAARGGHIVIWRAGTDGRVQRRMRLPRPKVRGNFSRTTNNMFVSMHWISPEQLLSAGGSGELMVWQVTDQSPRPKLVHNDHPKQLFCITSPFCHERESYTKWQDLAAWTIGPDRSILYTMLHSRKVLACYPTFSCSVHSSAASPIAATRMAIGLADGFIRVWDLSKENNQYIHMSVMKTKFAGKILSLAWHTSQDYLLAFGTEEGQIGYVNSGQSKKAPIYFAQHFLKAIHKLEWAPVPNKPAEKHGLYCCAEGQLAVFDLDHPLVNPAIVKSPKGERVTNFAWKADYSKLAIGCKSGTVYILDASYEVKTTLYYQKKAIVSMAWHPMQTAEDEEQSPNHDWIASATASDTIVAIYDLSKVSDELCMKDVIAGELVGHVKPVNQVFWSPYKNGMIATASEDGTITVWNGMKPISTFLNNNAEPLLSGMWSPLNEDVIISTGKDCTVRVWNLKNHPTKEQNDLELTRTARKKNLTNYRSRREMEQETNKSKRYPLLSEISARQAHLETAAADCRVMFEHYRSKETSEDNLILKLFGAASSTSEIIDEQVDTHRSKGKHAQANHLQMWTGCMGETIKKAIVDGNLTPWMISVAPMISFSLWHEAAEAYAGQLADSAISDPVEIASYYLALHMVDEAIDTLRAKQMYRDALVLAKFKKPDASDLHKQILEQWAKASALTGCFEIAAQSHLALGQFEEAARELYKRSNLPSLALAVELARLSGNDTLANTIQYRHDVLQAQAEDKLQLPSRIELELEKARKEAENAVRALEKCADPTAEEATAGVNGDGDHIDKNGDSGNNENGNGEIHVDERTCAAEEKTAEADNKEVDAVDNEPAESAKNPVVDDVADKRAEEGIAAAVVAADCTDDTTPSAN